MTDEQIWQNAFYYTLSTIAQTLAAAFGILATFMLFRFEHAEGKIESHGQRISESVSTMDASDASGDLVARLRKGDAEAVEAAVEQVIDEVTAKASAPKPKKHMGVETLRAAGERISFWAAFHKRAMQRLRQALLMTVTTIGMCMVQLPLMPLLTKRMALAATLTGIAVALSLVCLAMYARLILLLLRPRGGSCRIPARKALESGTKGTGRSSPRPATARHYCRPQRFRRSTRATRQMSQHSRGGVPAAPRSHDKS